MVCKEEVLMWFKELCGSKRIDVMCGLLNMCVPLELRFFGTCIEDQGRKDYNFFRDAEQKANSVSEIAKWTDLKDTVIRGKLIVSLALLHSSNHSCAHVIFKTLADQLKPDIIVRLRMDQQVTNEIFLLLTMAIYHPAFTFEQKTILSDLLKAFENLVQAVASGPTHGGTHIWQNGPQPIQQVPATTCGLPTSSAQSSNHRSIPTSHLPVAGISVRPSLPHSIAITPSSASTCPYHLQAARSAELIHRVRITGVEMKGAPFKKSYKIQVSWSNGSCTEVLKKHQDIAVFHQKLQHLLSLDSKGSDKKALMTLPTFPVGGINQNDEASDETIAQVSDYFRQLTIHLPKHIFENDLVASFFQLSSPKYATPKSSSSFTEDGASEGMRFRSLAIYNSHISDASSPPRGAAKACSGQPNGAGHVMAVSCRQGIANDQSPSHSVPEGPSPLTSPLSSPTSSPYVSPPASGTSSRSASPWTQRGASLSEQLASNDSTRDNFSLDVVLKNERLWKYTKVLQPYTIEELKVMEKGELLALGMTECAARKLKKILECSRSCSLPNGIIHSNLTGAKYVPQTSSGTAQFSQANSESSPSCSEYSSPPPSPPSLDTCGIHSSSSSGSEDSFHDQGKGLQLPGDNLGGSGGSSSCSVGSGRDGESGHCTTSSSGRSSVGSSKLGSKTAAILPAENGCTTRENGDVGRSSGSYVVPVPVTHSLPKPTSLPHQFRAMAGLVPVGSGTIIFENSQLGRTPLPCVGFGAAPRSHGGTPERSLPTSTAASFPFPITTSGSVTVPTYTRCPVTYRNSSSLAVTTVVSALSTGNRMGHKGATLGQSLDTTGLQQVPDVVPALYTFGPGCVMPSPSAVHTSTTCATSSCSCTCSSPSPAMQQPSPVTVPYFLPHIFPQAFPFLPSHSTSPANGFISPTMPTPNFPFQLPNGLSASVAPELLYSGQGYTMPSPPGPTPSPTANSSPSPVFIAFPGNCTFPQGPPANSVPPTNAPPKTLSCYNCGLLGHRGPDCKDTSMDDVTKAGQFRLNFSSTTKMADSHD